MWNWGNLRCGSLPSTSFGVCFSTMSNRLWHFWAACVSTSHLPVGTLVCRHPCFCCCWVLHGFWGFELRSSCLHGKCFACFSALFTGMIFHKYKSSEFSETIELDVSALLSGGADMSCRFICKVGLVLCLGTMQLKPVLN